MNHTFSDREIQLLEHIDTLTTAIEDALDLPSIDEHTAHVLAKAYYEVWEFYGDKKCHLKDNIKFWAAWLINIE